MELLSGCLNDNSYLAHICAGKKSESLKEHLEKVAEYACLLVKKHRLDGVVDRLVEDMAGGDSQKSRNWLKRMFAAVIVFHDTGKVNENFQRLRMMNRIFAVRKTEVLEPSYGHSFLGSWLFLAFILDGVWDDSQMTDEEKKCLFVYAFFFSYVIRQHHSAGLHCAGEEYFLNSFAGCYEEFRDYLTVWGYKADGQRIESVFKCIVGIQQETQKYRSSSFSLFSLLKLNSSLLTAADYLATHEYMNASAIDSLGIFEDRSRVEEMIGHLKNYKHNQEIYKNLNGFTFKYPVEKSGDHLNCLRTEMAVEVIQTIRAHPDDRLFYIEAPTGGGKTNLSMIAVTELMEKHSDIQKIFYVFPFTTLITQTYQTLQKALGLTSSELAELHSKAAFNVKKEENEDGIYGDKTQDYIDRLFALYPVCVLSHVKFFDMLKGNRKEMNYLFHRLANSVVVIDELQTYNPLLWDKMYYLIEQYARFFNVRFILMSATLPKIGKLNVPLTQKTEFVDLLPRAREYIVNPNFAGRVKFRFDLFQEKTDCVCLAEIVLEKSKEYALKNSLDGTVHTIIEFIYKKTASEFYRQIGDMASFFDEVLVLSGTVLEPRRREVINYLKNPANRKRNVLLITTQVVEAGVDIDMDLGFKNSSLLDSDEQLAGRVNRNARKSGCEVYLFRLDEAKVLYGKDERYKLVQKYITPEEYERMLIDKNFARLYELVFEKIDATNRETLVQNFHSEFLKSIERLDFADIDKGFQIIEQKNETIFVPLKIPVEIASKDKGIKERLISEMELDFLNNLGVVLKDGKLDGRDVWEIYEQFVSHSDQKSFNLDRKIHFKVLQRIMSWFTFSLIYQSKDLSELKCGFGEDRYGYFYLSHWDEDRGNGVVYDYNMGLNTNALKDIPFI